MNKNRNVFGIIATIILGLCTIGAFITELFMPEARINKKEEILFSILQFILSLGFGWTLTRAVTKDEYEASTKKFAIGAYRRITDIKKIVNRLGDEVEKMRRNYKSETYHALDIVKAIVVDIDATIKSSIADWADVIGNEILTIEKIQKLAAEKEQIVREPPTTQPDVIQSQLKTLEISINQLAESLPPKLRYENEPKPFNLTEAANKIKKEHNLEGGLRLKAFWDVSFERDPCDMQVGEKVFVSVDSVATRVGALIVKDVAGKKIGVVMNSLMFPYHDFVRAVARCFYEGRFSAEVVEIRPRETAPKEEVRHYFSIRILDAPVD